MAIEKFEAVVESVNGLQVSCKSREFEFTLDEPKNLGGTNTGMNPVEALLNSLGACKVIVAKSFARMHKIDLKSIKIEIEGELDPDGFMGKNKEAKIGFSKITTNFFIEANNTDEEIEKFVTFINRTCPVADTLENSPMMISKIIK
ncbi:MULTISPECIES: OsmC family protein [Vagococcus]|uniref:OsmC family protein n=1 Tax=Vagococcus fluvialis bH819 TaxID=1255619 RepID=A0A1X6WQF3_9ENTE|nr:MULTISPECIES: OsmC family protein [Vagococcus]SLM85876.1 OsmC family protein [Vagococcus fluvialis bH819]HCM90297.1 OsmC family peroxiredoxin [Vagococcus sp.]